MIAGEFKPRPNVKTCDEPWLSYCQKRALASEDMSLVANCGNDKQQPLEKVGVTTVKQLLARKTPVPGIADTKLEQLRQCARAFVDKRFIVLQDIRIPSAPVEFYLDFEGIDMDGEKFDYLIGILERAKDKAVFHPFVARSKAEHKKVVKDALALLTKHPDAPIFHYASYEKTALKQISDEYHIDVKPLLHRMTDLLQVLRRCIAPPTSTFSLKDIAKALGFRWRAGMDAGQSLVLYPQFLATKDEALLKKIIDYNEDDVRALLLVKENLEKHSKQGDSWKP
jgi:uncharacterized protein